RVGSCCGRWTGNPSSPLRLGIHAVVQAYGDRRGLIICLRDRSFASSAALIFAATSALNLASVALASAVSPVFSRSSRSFCSAFPLASKASIAASLSAFALALAAASVFDDPQPARQNSSTTASVKAVVRLMPGILPQLSRRTSKGQRWAAKLWLLCYLPCARW